MKVNTRYIIAFFMIFSFSVYGHIPRADCKAEFKCPTLPKVKLKDVWKNLKSKKKNCCRQDAKYHTLSEKLKKE